MLSKSIDQWLQEVRFYSQFYYDRYEHAITNYSLKDNIIDHYSKIASNYWNLKELLQHIKSFNTHIDRERCLACKNNISHTTVLNKTYDQYRKWIERLAVSTPN